MANLLEFIGKGWVPIVKAVIPSIEAKGGHVLQVKEKFGGLRIYSHGGDVDAIDDLIRGAERACAIICENCGRPGDLKNRHGILMTRCEKC